MVWQTKRCLNRVETSSKNRRPEAACLSIGKRSWNRTSLEWSRERPVCELLLSDTLECLASKDVDSLTLVELS